MRIESITPEIQTLFCKCLIANELGNNLSLAYQFSDAVAGKSGYSFGVSQLDVNNNPYAVLCLRECGFTTDGINMLKAKGLSKEDLSKFNSGLLEHKGSVDKWDARQIKECLNVPFALCKDANVEFSSLESFLNVADYHNQFYMSKGGKLHRWLRSQTTPVTPEMVRDFKMTQTKWGIDGNDDDIQHRYENIKRIASS